MPTTKLNRSNTTLNRIRKKIKENKRLADKNIEYTQTLIGQIEHLGSRIKSTEGKAACKTIVKFLNSDVKRLNDWKGSLTYKKG